VCQGEFLYSDIELILAYLKEIYGSCWKEILKIFIWERFVSNTFRAVLLVVGSLENIEFLANQGHFFKQFNRENEREKYTNIGTISQHGKHL